MSSEATETKPKAPARKGPTTVARAYFTALGEHDLDTAESLWKPGSMDRLAGLTEFPVPGPEFRSWFGSIFAAFPDFSFEILSITAQKNLAATHYIVRGTFNGTGKFEGLTPNGASLELEGCDLTTVEDGLIVANVGFINGTDMARQLGALPPAGLPRREGDDRGAQRQGRRRRRDPAAARPLERRLPRLGLQLRLRRVVGARAR